MEAVRDFILDCPSASCRCIAFVIGIDKNTVKKILTESLHLKKVLFKWVPHELSNEQKQKRVFYSNKLLSKLLHFSEGQLMKLITCDESWFFLCYFFDGMWTDSDSRPQIPRRQISDKKYMFFTSFSIAGPVLIEFLPPNTRFNSTYMCTTILPKLNEQANKIKTKSQSIKVRIHMDNARPHNSKMTMSKISELNMERLDHPPFSPDLSPNDFFLYGFVKDQLKGTQHRTGEELLNSITEIMNKIDKNTWKKVYENWIERLKMVIEREGNYL